MKSVIYLAHGHTSLEILHSLFPFFADLPSLSTYNLCLVDYRFHDLSKLSGDVIIIVRRYQNLCLSTSAIHRELTKLKKNFNRIVYFDDSAASSYIIFDVLELVDSYWVRSVLKDKKLYSQSFYGGRPYSHYAHTYFDIDDTYPTLSPATVIYPADKVKIAWNLGIGCFPFNSTHLLSKYYPLIRKLSTLLTIQPTIRPFTILAKAYMVNMIEQLSKPIDLSKKKYLVNARFTSECYTKSVGFQRSYYLRLLASDYKSLFVTGRICFKSYLKECETHLAMLSPFGWGEICYRDFEAALNGMLLIKPSMHHIDTWPNIYTSDSYLSLPTELSSSMFDTILNNDLTLYQNRVECSRLIYSKAFSNLDNILVKLLSII